MIKHRFMQNKRAVIDQYKSIKFRLILRNEQQQQPPCAGCERSTM